MAFLIFGGIWRGNPGKAAEPGFPVGMDPAQKLPDYAIFMTNFEKKRQ